MGFNLHYGMGIMKIASARVMLPLLLLASARLCLAQTVYEVEGTVYGPDGNVLANVVMSLQNHGAVQIDQDITKSDGRYRFAGVLAGTYYLAVKPPDKTVQSVVQKIELINSGVSASNFSKERFDFTLKNVTTPQSIAGTIFAQVVPPEAEKLYQTALA